MIFWIKEKEKKKKLNEKGKILNEILECRAYALPHKVSAFTYKYIDLILFLPFAIIFFSLSNYLFPFTVCLGKGFVKCLNLMMRYL